MASKAKPNPYGASVPEYAGQYANAPEYGSPNGAYAVPSVYQDAPYTDTFGWGPKPHISVSSTPDAMRLGVVETRTVRPGDDAAPGEFYRPLDADDKRRHSVEDQDADGWTEQKASYKIGPDPRATPPPETRWTERLSPNNYSFTRPFDQGTKGNGARHLNGTHFSMADHRREYDILGMQPWGMHRNTYRISPAPWDANLYDVPPAETIGAQAEGRIQAVEVPSSGNRSFRL